MGDKKVTTTSIEELYVKEKKKSNILAGVTVLLASLLIWSLASRPKTAEPALATDQQNIEQGENQQRGFGGRGGQAITEFFDSDGEVDEETVSALYERISQGGDRPGADPTQFLERFNAQIDIAVENGEISQSQGEQLKSELSALEGSET